MGLSDALSTLPGMREVEALIGSRCNSEFPLLTEIPKYLFTLGGKRLRPALTLAAGRAFGISQPTSELIDIAAGIELIHMATLLHDDIIDNSPLRRKHPSPYVKYGSAPTLLSGDFLLVRAFGLCATLPQPIIKATEQACVELTEGELEEIALELSQHTLETSLRVARKKTAALFRLATFSAASLAGLPGHIIEESAKVGETLGIAFQILDDILDVTSTDEELGKQPGLDIKERKPSFVNILWLTSGSKQAQRLLSNEPLSDEFVAQSLKELRNSPIIEKSRQTARDYALKASQGLDKVVSEVGDKAGGEELALMQALIQFTVDRVS
jgi:geranylgeranyl pyrophosphate synthase